MKFYLSSFRLGNNPEELIKLFSNNKKIGIIANAIDDSELNIRKEKVNDSYLSLKELGLEPIELDLRKYFNNTDLINKLNELGGVWVRGGNSFTLRKAMKLSGFDNWILSNLKREDFVYAGYSAAVVVMQKDLYGIELVDPVNLKVPNYPDEPIWEGLGILDYYVAVHFRSDHPESPLVENLVNVWLEEGKLFRTLKDGEVIITNINI